MPTITAGRKAPDFELPTTDGKVFSLTPALERGLVLAAFFKVSCPTCQYAFPFLERLYQQLRAAGAQIWGISQDEVGDSQLFAKEFGITFPTLIDEYPYEASRQYGLQYVPTLFLIAPGARVEIMSDGFCKADFLAIQKSLGQHLGVNPPPLFQPNEHVPEFKPG